MFVRGRERHRVHINSSTATRHKNRFVNADEEFAQMTARSRASRLFKPPLKLCYWIEFQIAAAQPHQVILSSEIGNRHDRGFSERRPAISQARGCDLNSPLNDYGFFAGVSASSSPFRNSIQKR